jgi:nicotinamidase-related amidase
MLMDLHPCRYQTAANVKPRAAQWRRTKETAMTAQTLFALAGLAPQPARLPAAPLVLIDCQYEYLDGRLALPGIDAPLAVIARLLAAARAGGGRIIHVAHRGKPGDTFDRRGRGGAFIDAVAPIAGEVVVEKTFANAFAGTDLATHLPDGGPLVLVGFMTHNCISSTARAAVERGFLPTIIGEACATRDLPDGAGGVVPADVVHRIELVALADRHAVVAGPEEVVG